MSRVGTHGMEATIECLVEEGSMTQEDADKFLNSHTVICVHEESLLSRIKKKLFPNKAAAGTSNILFKAIKV